MQLQSSTLERRATRTPPAVAVRITDADGVWWRVVDLVHIQRGPRRAVAPGSDFTASERFFIREDRPDVRRFSLTNEEAFDTSPSALLHQLKRIRAVAS
jgi:hypothetical protein